MEMYSTNGRRPTPCSPLFFEVRKRQDAGRTEAIARTLAVSWCMYQSNHYCLPILPHSQCATVDGDDAPSPPAARRLASRIDDMSILPSSGVSALRNA